MIQHSVNKFSAAFATLFFASWTSIAAAQPPSFVNPAPPKFAQKSDQSIVEFAIEASGGEGAGFPDENHDDFDLLVAALVATTLVFTFDGTKSHTVFAPNDAAFLALTGLSSEQEALDALVADLAGLEAVLLYHVTKGVRNSRSVTRARSIEMLDGNTISGRSGDIEATGSTAVILDADNRLADGMVHVVDTVLLPFEVPME